MARKQERNEIEKKKNGKKKERLVSAQKKDLGNSEMKRGKKGDRKYIVGSGRGKRNQSEQTDWKPEKKSIRGKKKKVETPGGNNGGRIKVPQRNDVSGSDFEVGRGGGEGGTARPPR